MTKENRISFRIDIHEKEIWEIYARKMGYEHLSEFIRNTINREIEKGKKLIIIKNPK